MKVRSEGVHATDNSAYLVKAVVALQWKKMRKNAEKNEKNVKKTVVCMLTLL